MQTQLALDGLRAGLQYLAKNPTDIFQAAKHAAGLKIAIPIGALRWLVARQPAKKGAPKDIVLGANPPALSVGATVDLMGNGIRLETDIRIEELTAAPDELRVTLRLGNFRLNALDPNSPAAMLFKSLDLTKPANLVNFLPARPPALVEATGDKLVVDLMKVPKLAKNPLVQRLLKVVTPLVSIRDISTDGDLILIKWRPTPSGVPAAVAGLRR
jgi:hypothetical protein